jgi:hypothetical protein
MAEDAPHVRQSTVATLVTIMSDERDTWGPSPGDATAPPPTPQAPEIPMTSSWLWLAGAGVALRYVLPVAVVLAVIVGIVGLFAHWW